MLASKRHARIGASKNHEKKWSASRRTRRQEQQIKQERRVIKYQAKWR